MFSSCLENIEPEGIADLRGAKAELLRAQTALAEAKAARENAEAALTQAKAKVEEAKVKQEEARAKKMEAEALLAQYEAEYQALENAAYEAEKAIELEQKMAEAKAAIALAEKQAAVYAAELERALMLIQADVVEAQAAYEEALKNLELAKNGLTAEQKAYLEDYFAVVDNWQTQVDILSFDLVEKTIALEAAIATLDASAASATLIRGLEVAIIRAEASIKGTEKAAEIIKAAMELDPKAAEWAEELAKYQAEVDAKTLEFKEGKTERDERKTELQEKQAELNAAKDEYVAATGYTYTAALGTFSDESIKINRQELAYPDVKIPSPKDEKGENLFYGRNDINWKGTEYTTDSENNVVPIPNNLLYVDFYYQYPDHPSATTVFEAFDDEIANYEALANTDASESNIANRKALIKGQEENLTNVAQKEDYEAMVAAYKADDPTQYFKAVAEEAGNEYDIEKAVTDYNTALEAMVSAMDAVNAEYKRLYDAADANEKALLDAQAAKETAEAIADGVYYSKLQTALNTYKAAEKTFETAFFTYQRATNTYNAAMAEAVAAVNALEAPYGLGATPADVAAKIEAALTANASNTDEAYTKAGGPKSVYTTQQANVKAAQEAYDDAVKTDDATDVWKKAQEAFAKAGGPANCVPTYTPGVGLTYTDEDYYKTNASGQYKKDVDAASNAWNAAKTAAQTEYYLKEAELANSGVELNTQYMYALEQNYDNAKTALNNAIDIYDDPAVEGVRDYAFIKSELVAVEMGVKPVPVDYPDYVQFTGNFPDYLVDEETKALKAIEVADIIDKEYFLAEMVKPAADNVYAVMTVPFVNYQNKETGETGTSYYVVIGAPADYPLSVPTYEEYVKAIEAFEGDNAAEKAEAYAEEAWRVFRNECIASGGYAYPETVYCNYSGTETAIVFGYKDEIAAFEVAIANSEKAAEHVAVLEKAKAEFEAWAKTEEDRIDALRPVVEGELLAVTNEINDINNAETAFNDEMTPVNNAISDLKGLIDEYIEKVPVLEWDSVDKVWEEKDVTVSDGDVEKFLEDLAKAYDEALIAVADYQAQLEDAKTTLEKAKAGDFDGNETLVENVKTAQEAYDACAAKLEYALSRLAEATEALKDAMEAIGAVEPEAEDTPAE